MKKLGKKIISLILVLCMFISVIAFDVLASTPSVSDYHYYNLAEYALPEGYCTEIIDGTLYAYLVEDGEAYILNIQTNRCGPDKTVLTLPTMLGGYPVISIGAPNDYRYIFEYLSYTDSLYPEGYDEATGLGYSECDPGLSYVSEIIIPEGYKYIRSGAFLLCANTFSLPKSLIHVENFAFEEFYNYTDNATGEKYAFLPECSVGWDMAVTLCNNIVIPSRNPYLFSKSAYMNWGYYKILYVPYNASYELAKRIFYTYDAAIGDAGGWYQSGPDAAVHCAPNSPWLQVFEDMGGHDTATIITDVTPAEYIAFPEKTVNVHVGDVVDLEAKTYPTDAIWTACDYKVSDPSVVKIDEYSGRITALKEGTVTVTATHCERGFVDTCTVNVVPEPVPGVNEIKPATDTPYYSYGNRDYTLDVTGSPSKIQVVRDNGGTTTIDRRRAKVTSNGETETWVVNMRVEAGTHNIRAKYGNKWDERLTPFTVTYDTPPTPKAYSFDLGYENGLGTFEVVTDPQIIKVQFLLDNGCTLTYSQGNSYVAEDGLRHWVITRKIPANTNYTLKTKLGYTWTTTDLTVNS